MHTTTKLVLAGVSTAVLTAGIGAGIAAADTPSPAPTPSTTATAAPGQPPAKAPHAPRHPGWHSGKHRDLAARALHGEVTLGGQAHRVVDFQRGTVQQVTATSLTVKSTDGFTATYTVNGGTRVRVDKKLGAISGVKVTDHVRVVALKSGSALTAKRVVDRS